MRIVKLALAALFAVMAFSALAVSSASAFHPLFLTQSGKTLLILGLGVDPILRGEQAGVAATILCEKVLVHGFVLHASTLLHLLKIIFHGKCVQKIGTGGNETCTEPIETKPILAEIGLLTSSNPKVVILLGPSDGTTNFASPVCGGHETKVGGVIVAEIPAENAARESQIETERTEYEVKFATLNKNNHQSITEIFLLGAQMTKQELSIEGFLGGPASEEVIVKLDADGWVRICLK